MKYSTSVLAAFLLSTCITNAQAPQAISYQAVARDVTGTALADTPLVVQLRLLEGSASGTISYVETHSTTTNNVGLFTLGFGLGTVVQGVFGEVNWASAPHFLEVAIDIASTGSFTIIGTQQLLSVPYALYSDSSGTSDSDWFKFGTTTPPDGINNHMYTLGNVTLGEQWVGGSRLSVNTNDIGVFVQSYDPFAPTTLAQSFTSIMYKDSTTGLQQGDRNQVRLGFGANGGSESTRMFFSAIEAVVEDPAFSTRKSGLRFLTNNANTFATEHMRISGLGMVGIGTANPTSKLHVDGTFRLVNGTEGSGKVLTSDAAGNASWSAGQASTSYAIGDFAQGGIVFWVDETGEHGLVCAKNDQSAGVAWYAGSYTRTLANGTGPLAGEMNTAIIITNQGLGNGNMYAARICAEQSIAQGGKVYGDWYLPSSGELNRMFQDTAIINTTAIANGGTAFIPLNYWSSTETFNTGDFAGIQDFSSGGATSVNPFDKNTVARVRAVRAF